MRMHICSRVCLELRDQYQVSFFMTICLVWNNLSLNLEHVDLARLAGGSQGSISLSQSLRHCDYGHMLLYLAFRWFLGTRIQIFMIALEAPYH